MAIFYLFMAIFMRIERRVDGEDREDFKGEKLIKK